MKSQLRTPTGFKPRQLTKRGLIPMNSHWNLRTRVTTYVALAVFMMATMMVPLGASAQANKVNTQASKSVLVQGTTANGGTLSGVLTLANF
jgi:hypothetical protein